VPARAGGEADLGHDRIEPFGIKLLPAEQPGERAPRVRAWGSNSTTMGPETSVEPKRITNTSPHS
jgi:hypothetical protein